MVIFGHNLYYFLYYGFLILFHKKTLALVLPVGQWRQNVVSYMSDLCIFYGSPYLPVPLLATIGQPEKQHKGSANRKRELM